MINIVAQLDSDKSDAYSEWMWSKIKPQKSAFFDLSNEQNGGIEKATVDNLSQP